MLKELNVVPNQLEQQLAGIVETLNTTATWLSILFSLVVLGTEISLSTLNSTVQGFNVLGHLVDAFVKGILVQRALIRHLTKHLHMVDQAQVFLSQGIFTLQEFSLVRDLLRVFQNLQGVFAEFIQRTLRLVQQLVDVGGDFAFASCKVLPTVCFEKYVVSVPGTKNISGLATYLYMYICRYVCMYIYICIHVFHKSRQIPISYDFALLFDISHNIPLSIYLYLSTYLSIYLFIYLSMKNNEK